MERKGEGRNPRSLKGTGKRDTLGKKFEFLMVACKSHEGLLALAYEQALR